MVKINRNAKGQLSIEFLIILVIMLLLFSGISLDLINSSIEDASLIEASETINSADFLLKSTSDSMVLQGSGAKKTVHVRAPSYCNYLILPTEIIVECEEKSTPYEDFNGITIGPAPLPGDIEYFSETGIIEMGKSGAIEISKV